MSVDSPNLDEETATTRWRELARLERWLDKPMLALAVVWLALLVVELTRGLSPFFESVGVVIWIVFIGDFVLRMVLAPDRATYLRRNWLTAISLVVPPLRIFRVFRALRILRAARGVRLVRVVAGVNRGMGSLGEAMHRKGFGYVVALTMIVTLLGAAGMYAFERGSDPAGITDFPSALWWTAMIITTMGSDFWPVTPEGRILCFLLSLYALGIFGYLAAALAAYFVGRDEEAAGRDAESAEIKQLIAEIAELRAEVREQRIGG